jgi:hypothetical protein
VPSVDVLDSLAEVIVAKAGHIADEAIQDGLAEEGVVSLPLSRLGGAGGDGSGLPVGGWLHVEALENIIEMRNRPWRIRLIKRRDRRMCQNCSSAKKGNRD